MFPNWERTLFLNRETLLDHWEISIFPSQEKISQSTMKNLKIMICAAKILIFTDSEKLKDSKELEGKAQQSFFHAV